MFIQFDPQTMHVQVICGIAEDYKPSKEIKEVEAKVNNLKDKMQKFMTETVQPELKVIHEEINGLNKKHTKTQE